MEAKKIYEEKGQGFTRIFSSEKVENVNPVDYYKKYELEKRAIVLRDLINAKDANLASQLDDSFFLKQAEDTIVGFFEKFENTEIHENFCKLLETERKKNQINLLKGLSLNPDQLMSLIFKFLNSSGLHPVIAKNLKARKNHPSLLYKILLMVQLSITLISGLISLSFLVC